MNELERAVRDERWQSSWVLYPPLQNTNLPWTVFWIDDEHVLHSVAGGPTAEAAAQAALSRSLTDERTDRE